MATTISRDDFFYILSTVLAGEGFKLDETKKTVSIKLPVTSDNVEGLTDVVKSVFKNVLKPAQSSYKIFGDFIDYDSTLKVNEKGELGVSDSASSESSAGLVAVPEDVSISFERGSDARDLVVNVNGQKITLSFSPKFIVEVGEKTVKIDLLERTNTDSRIIELEQKLAQANRRIDAFTQLIDDKLNAYLDGVITG
jgi:hypothetical protein